MEKIKLVILSGKEYKNLKDFKIRKIKKGSEKKAISFFIVGDFYDKINELKKSSRGIVYTSEKIYSIRVNILQDSPLGISVNGVITSTKKYGQNELSRVLLSSLE